ncbi:hypothetical protein LX16_0946 [Stackebrandtia albiflava]|uniref:Uncharacterized protein n=1 Tax=Stackebrandtia albiflava TaxID=406432 RepID=A0A562VBI2_9ACTN|nr:hypothetical protein [Stackebrandtia albiflava]TWJ15246.1 hypothetical protein LX16_0946 [Stackebrandtia albiflava]
MNPPREAVPATDVAWAGLTVYGTWWAETAQQVLTVTSAPTARDTLRVWGVWRARRTLLVTISCPDGLAEARWGAGWVDNPPEWRREIETGALAVYARWRSARTCDG